MNWKKFLPIVLLVLMAMAVAWIKSCDQEPPKVQQKPVVKTTKPASPNHREKSDGRAPNLDRQATNLYFTKHAKCRMECREISQLEVRDILANGTVNYKKSNLRDTKGPTYAVEGNTTDGQHVRIIFAPKQKHLTVVTVIDLDVEHECSCP